MNNTPGNPRIVIVTPEVKYLPEGMGNLAEGFSAKARGLADVSAALISTLFEQGADVHVALPDYRTIFDAHLMPLITKELDTIRSRMPQERIHLAEDQVFFYVRRVYSSYGGENAKIALAFQREVINNIVSHYWEQNLEIVFVASGEFQKHFKEIVQFHQLFDRVAVCDFDEAMACLAYGASDFVLMPSAFEPCGLPQMISPIYGALPVAHDTGGIHDTIEHMNVVKNTGNGFLFETFDSKGLF
jgi:starch synthase/alpha-amylase